MNNIETPETDKMWDDCEDSCGNPFCAVDVDFARDLERRLAIEKQRAEEMGKLAHLSACESAELRESLTIAREALGKIVAQKLTIERIEAFAEEALAQTAPKL